jgi:protein involved in polysaccharide export with SLBB domain
MRRSVFALLIWLITLPLLSVAAPQTYRLGPEDTITVTVLKHAEFSGTFLIPADGVVNFPGVGPLQVTGQTTSELADALVGKLKARLNTPEVTVTLNAPRITRVYVLGAVAKPGILDLKANWGINEALAAAGGLTQQPSDCSVTLLRAATGELQSVDLIAAQKAGAGGVKLQPGDVLTVSAVETIPIYVMGLVAHPGMFALRKGAGALEALTLAGGPTGPDTESSLLVLRGKTTVAEIALTTVARGKTDGNVPLERGDVVQVVSTQQRMPIFVMGAVRAPGVQQVRTNAGVAEALALAGGLTLTDTDTRITLLRNGREVGIVTAKTDTPLQPFDILRIDPLSTLSVMVYGKVVKPGTYLLKETDGPLQALALAGGAVDTAALSRVTVVHQNGASETLDLSAPTLTGQPAATTKLAHGDLIIVPESFNKVAVLGAVLAPGFYPLLDGKPVTLSEVLSQARGTDKRARIAQVGIVRRANGKEARHTYDLAKFMRTGDAANNPVILPGDIIYVPGARMPDWSVIFQGLSALSVTYGYVLK